MSETFVVIGAEITPPLCRYSSHGQMMAKGSRSGRYPFQCMRCGMRVLVCTSPKKLEPLYVWRMDCPPRMHFYDYVKQCMGEDVQDYEPGNAGIELPQGLPVDPKKDPVAAPG
jgi:hypothetical protein